MFMSMSVPHSLLLFSSIFFTYLPGFIICADVTLSSMEIFTTHEWLKHTPDVYFSCKGDNKVHLPDIKKAHVFYSFKGEESWQAEHISHNLVGNHDFYSMFQWFVQLCPTPLTNFTGKKCKRCGFYEKDKILSDDEFDEWELCPSDFTAPDGRYIHFKEKEFNASFLCPECVSFYAGGEFLATLALTAIRLLDFADNCVKEVGSLVTYDVNSTIIKSSKFKTTVSAPATENHKKKGMNVAVIILISVLISTVLILGMVGAYKFWQKKKREQDQARFLKLFEDADDIEDELGLGTII
ncbi:hypothetical protein Fmac_006291 [Flemingia macrophylla]|uniref:DUF7953 domain-containing protein n=1 Tax=Flemingia macrophylla TaxID=520843 RepID=A0ABD1NA61_9FABA